MFAGDLAKPARRKGGVFISFSEAEWMIAGGIPMTLEPPHEYPSLSPFYGWFPPLYKCS